MSGHFNPDGPSPDLGDCSTSATANAQGMFSLDGEGRVDFVDARAAQILGHAPEDVAGGRFADLLFGEIRPRALSIFEQHRDGYGGINELPLRHREGKPVWVTVASLPRFGEDGAFLGVTGFITDIDEHRRQQKLSEHRQRLLSRIAANLPLDAILDDLCLTLEAVLRRPLHAIVTLAEDSVLRCVAAPSLPPRFRKERSGYRLEGRQTACARAVRSGQSVFIPDATSDEAPPEIVALHRDYGIGAVWSYPVIQDGDTLGTLSLLPLASGSPDAEEERIVDFALQVARLALAHERKAEALRQSEQRFRDYAELSADWYWEQDAEFRFTSMSGGIYNKGGFRVADSLGKTRWELPVEGVSEAQWAAHRAQLERREAFRDFVYRILTANGEKRWYAISGKPVFGADGGFLGYRGIGRDITAQKRAEEALRELSATLETRVRARTAALEEANRELDAFNFSVSHDLRTPLRAIEGFSQALLEDCHPQLDAEGQEHLRRIAAATTRMGELIEALYDLSRLSRAPLFLRPTDLSALAREIADELRQRAPARDIEIDIADLPFAAGDARLLRIALANLLGNAWKYTARTPRARIAFGTETDEQGRAVYFVRDNGAGFDMRFADKLFRMFHRLHREEDFGGQGVGLSTAQRIVARHGGRIWAESSRGEGATFFFTLWEDAALLREAAESMGAIQQE